MIPQILEALVAFVDASDAKRYSTAQCVIAQVIELVHANRAEVDAAIAAQKAKVANG